MPKLGVARFTLVPPLADAAIMCCNVQNATRSKVIGIISDVANEHNVVIDVTAEVTDDKFVYAKIIFAKDATEEGKFLFVQKLVAETRNLDEDKFRCNTLNVEFSMAVSARGSSTNES